MPPGHQIFFFVLAAGDGRKNDEVKRNPGWARFCLADGDGSITITVQTEDGDEELVESAVAGLRVRNITLTH